MPRSSIRLPPGGKLSAQLTDEGYSPLCPAAPPKAFPSPRERWLAQRDGRGASPRLPPGGKLSAQPMDEVYRPLRRSHSPRLPCAKGAVRRSLTEGLPPPPQLLPPPPPQNLPEQTRYFAQRNNLPARRAIYLAEGEFTLPEGQIYLGRRPHRLDRRPYPLRQNLSIRSRASAALAALSLLHAAAYRLR